MSGISLRSIAVGDRLPPHKCGPITRTTLALFAGASGDHNPIHVDLDFARQSGMPDVFAHGMLTMAYMAQLITRWVPQSCLRRWNVRFMAITPVNVTLFCSGTVREKFVHEGQDHIRLDLEARLEDGRQTLKGEAIVALP